MLEYEWDERKRLENIGRRGVDFRLAASIFRGPVIESEDARNPYGETRWRALGETDGEHFLVVYTWRGQTRRIISARKVGENGKQRYEALLGR